MSRLFTEQIERIQAVLQSRMTLTIIVNGRPQTIEAGTSVASLIEQLGLHATACAAEVNTELVPKRRHAETVLKEGDAVELVSLVGGG